jgi:ribosome biogenesis protein MAK21
MAKNNAKRSKTAEVSASNSHATPTFDENALSALTDKIERGLDTTKAPKQKVAAKEKKSPEKNRGENGTTPRHAISAAANGRKRDAQGNVKQKSDSKKHTNDRKKEKTPVDRAVLLQEILALGGTEDDLDLIADISSEEEEDVENHAHASSHDAKFAKELSKFVSGLGIEGQAGAEVDESENGEEEDGEEEEQDDWEDEPGMSPKPPIVPAWAPAPKDEKRSDKVTKDPTRLVSMTPGFSST